MSGHSREVELVESLLNLKEFGTFVCLDTVVFECALLKPILAAVNALQ